MYSGMLCGRFEDTRKVKEIHRTSKKTVKLMEKTITEPWKVRKDLSNRVKSLTQHCQVPKHHIYTFFEHFHSSVPSQGLRISLWMPQPSGRITLRGSRCFCVLTESPARAWQSLMHTTTKASHLSQVSPERFQLPKVLSPGESVF